MARVKRQHRIHAFLCCQPIAVIGGQDRERTERVDLLIIERQRTPRSVLHARKSRVSFVGARIFSGVCTSEREPSPSFRWPYKGHVPYV